MNKRGFTLIELVIVLAIMAMFFGISVPLFSRFGEKTQLEATARSIASTLTTARGYSIKENVDYYVFFDSTTSPHTYFISKADDGSSSIEKTSKLPPGISFYYHVDWEDPDPAGPIGFTKGTTANAALFKPTGELDETTNDTAVYIADDTASSANWKKIAVERTTGRVRVN